MSGEQLTQDLWCNNRVECYNGGVDEKYCTLEEEEMFQCRNEDGAVLYEIPISKKCDEKCGCYYGCADEWQCNGYRYHYWYKCYNSSRIIPSYSICDNYTDCNHGDDESNCGNVTKCITDGDSTDTYILANYSRCTPSVWCTNKMDQTNCSDATLAPLQCTVRGYTSTVSKHSICNYYRHSDLSAVCDDGIDVQCVTLPSDCYIHKHQLCNNITDCKGGSDEKSVLCFRVAAQECKRKFNYNTSLSLPIGWIGDGIEDCVGGVDEDITKWNSCVYNTFTIYGSDECEDVFICPSGYRPYVEIPSLCDEMLSCQGGNKICSTATSTLVQLRYTPIKVEDVVYLHYCLVGLQNLNTNFNKGCEHVIYPTVEILGTKPNLLYLPIRTS